MKKILIIDDEKPVRDVLNIALTEEGYALSLAANGKQGLEIFQEKEPDIVITDVMMPEMDGIEVTKKLKDVSDKVDVVIMSGFGTEELVIEALRAGASNYIKKPIAFDELFQILDTIIFKRENRKRIEVAKDVVFKEQKEIIIGNNISEVWGTVNQVLFNIHSGISHNTIEGISIGLYEIIINAIEHGNLDISYEDKSRALKDNSYPELLSYRKVRADRQKKNVFINCRYTRDEMVVEVKDQGKGFDLDNLPDLNNPEAIISDHGRGILLASLFFDEVNFREPGNCVELIKRFQS
jgi:YesN/AraC family two-component response regulator